MNSNLTYKKLDCKSVDFKVFNEIYEEAFLPEERVYSLAQLLKLCNNNRFILGAYDGNEVVGFIIYLKYNDYIYILYFATSNKIRSKGYGTKILQDLIKINKDFKIYGFAETPDPKAENYKQRIARKKFYEKNGFRYSKYTCFSDGTNMTVFSNFDENLIPKCVGEAIKYLDDVLDDTEINVLKSIASMS